jgi:tRNA (cmo5U34)-methyltransferase
MILSKMPNLNYTSVDLIRPKAFERGSKRTNSEVKDNQNRQVEKNHFDVILVGAVLYHLRNGRDWESKFTKLYKLLSPGGCLMISDLIIQDNELLVEYMLETYEDYLEKVGGAEYIRKVFGYFARENTPRSINYQLYFMKKNRI